MRSATLARLKQGFEPVLFIDGCLHASAVVDLADALHLDVELTDCKVRGLAAVRRCYAEGGGDCYAKL